MDQPEAPAALAALTESAIHMVARVEALETILIQKKIATREEIEGAIVRAGARNGALARGIRRPNEQGFESALVEILRRLQIRQKDRPQ
jgi:hypothetical protein